MTFQPAKILLQQAEVLYSYWLYLSHHFVRSPECNLGKGPFKRQCSGANPSIYRSFVVSSTPLISRAHRLTLEINGADTRGVRSPDDSWSEMACMLPAFAVQKTSFVSGAKIASYLPWMQFSVLLWIQTLNAVPGGQEQPEKHFIGIAWNTTTRTRLPIATIKIIWNLSACNMLSPTARPQHL